MSALSPDCLEQQSFFTPQEISDLLQVSVHTVRRWIRDGDLPAYRIGRLWRIKPGDLDNWLARQGPTAAIDD